MRLLEYNSDGELSLTKDFGDDLPRYAILSHTWGADAEEVIFRDLIDGTGKSKDGYNKIRFCGEQARRDCLQYFWVDTCCIDKSSSTELSEAINSMFRWYQNAAKCYVYLSDVSIIKRKASNQSSECTWEAAFRASRWFTRGWTLQELLAPGSVEFFSREGKRLGDKRTLERQVHEITGIAVSALQGTSLSQFGFDERLSWAENRQTTRKEDKAYSLLGIFDVYMPLIYGEGRDNALIRLREEIDKPSKGSLQWIAYHPPTSRNVTSPSHPPVQSIRSQIEKSYLYYFPDLPLQFGSPRLPLFYPYRLTCKLEKSILTSETIEELGKEAEQLSLCDFFLKPDNIRCDALWNGEKELDYKNLSATTIKDILLSMNKDIHSRSERISIRKFLFNCILQVYRSHVDEYEFSSFQRRLNGSENDTVDTCLCMLGLCYRLGPAWAGWHLSLIACLVQKISMSKMKEYFRPCQRPVAFHILLRELQRLSPPLVADRRTALDYIEVILGECHIEREGIAAAVGWTD